MDAPVDPHATPADPGLVPAADPGPSPPADPGLVPPADPGPVPRADADAAVTGVQPLDIDGTRTVLVITLLWAAAFCVLLPFWDRLEDADRLWWLWTCLAGVGLGLFGIEYCRRRARRRLRRAAAARAGG